MQHNHSPPTARKRAPFAQVAGVLRGDWRLPGPQVASRAGITASQSWFIPGRASIAGGDPSSPGWMPSCQHSLAGDTVQAASTGNGHSAQQGREGRWREGLLLGRETRRRPMDAYTRTRCSGFTIRLMVAVKSDAGAPGRGLTAPINRETRPPVGRLWIKKEICGGGIQCLPPAAEYSPQQGRDAGGSLLPDLPPCRIPFLKEHPPRGYFLDSGAKLEPGRMRMQVPSRESRWNFQDPWKGGIPGFPGAVEWLPHARGHARGGPVACNPFLGVEFLQRIEIAPPIRLQEKKFSL
jgi:hypothetical protein